MNLYVVGWNFPSSRIPMVLKELSQMVEVYPHLDPDTLWHYQSPSQTFFIASMHTSNTAAAPRCYVHHNEDEVTLYAGLPIDPESNHPVHRAGELSTHWNNIAKNLEGQFALFRALKKTGSLELVTDICGFERVFCRAKEDMWLLSNNIGLIERVSAPSMIDPVGMSLFLSSGDLAEYRTLLEDIQIVPGGQHWTWSKGEINPTKSSYFSPSSLARKSYEPISETFIKDLSAKMLKLCRSLNTYFEPITCSLTGGRDSRLLAAMLIHAGIQAKYYTAGNPASADMRIASLHAKNHSLQHEVSTINSEDVLNNWDDLCKRHILQSEGLISLWQVADILKQNRSFKQLDLFIWGAGGEIGRSYFGDPELFIGKKSMKDIQSYLKKQIVHSRGGLIREEAITLANAYVDRFVVQNVDRGFSPLDIPDLEHSFGGALNWFGNTARTSMMISDLFSPFFSRAFLEATFTLSPQQRYTEPLHYHLIFSLAPDLHSMPFDKPGWWPQQPMVNLLYRYGYSKLAEFRANGPTGLREFKNRILPKREKVKPYDKISWLEIKLEQVREMCLDQNDSPLWDYVDRTIFERVSSSVTNPEVTFKQKLKMFIIATAFQYEELRRKKYLSERVLEIGEIR